MQRREASREARTLRGRSDPGWSCLCFQECIDGSECWGYLACWGLPWAVRGSCDVKEDDMRRGTKARHLSRWAAHQHDETVSGCCQGSRIGRLGREALTHGSVSATFARLTTSAISIGKLTEGTKLRSADSRTVLQDPQSCPQRHQYLLFCLDFSSDPPPSLSTHNLAAL